MTDGLKKRPDIKERKLATPTGLPMEAVVTPEELRGFEPERDLGYPGQFPFTRGVYPSMYRGRLWTTRQYAGFGTAVESNERYRYLLAQGVHGLSVAFDLPTQIGMDSDHPLAVGEVGNVGVAIDSLEDMQTLFDGIPLERVSTSMTINSTAAILLALYVAVAKQQGASLATPRGNGAERCPEGVHRARNLHLPAAPGDAHRHRHFRVVPAGIAELECDFDFRLPHSRSRLDGRAGSCFHAGERNCVCGIGDRGGAFRR